MPPGMTEKGGMAAEEAGLVAQASSPCVFPVYTFGELECAEDSGGHLDRAIHPRARIKCAGTPAEFFNVRLGCVGRLKN